MLGMSMHEASRKLISSALQLTCGTRLMVINGRDWMENQLVETRVFYLPIRAIYGSGLAYIGGRCSIPWPGTLESAVVSPAPRYRN